MLLDQRWADGQRQKYAEEAGLYIGFLFLGQRGHRLIQSILSLYAHRFRDQRPSKIL